MTLDEELDGGYFFLEEWNKVGEQETYLSSMCFSTRTKEIDHEVSDAIVTWRLLNILLLSLYLIFFSCS